MGPDPTLVLMRAIVVGACGAVGREVSAGLIRTGAFERIVLADLDGRHARALARGLGHPATGRVLDARDAGRLREALRDVDLLVNCTTYHLGVTMLRAAIAARVDYIDLGGLYNTPRQLELDARARRAGIRAVIGCGATPGLSNVLARRAASMLDRTEEVHVAFASHRDPAPSEGLLDTLLDEFRPGVARFRWRRGRFEEVGPFEGARRVRFAPPLGVQEVYFVPHSETYTLPRSFGNGLREVDVRGTWRPADMRALATLARFGLTSERPIDVAGTAVRPIDVLRSLLLADPPEDRGAPWAFYLNVEVIGRRDGERIAIEQRTRHPADWGVDATGRMTAVPVVAGAIALARGHVEGSGVMPPEVAFDPRTFLREVRRAGVHVALRRRSVSSPRR